MEIKVKVTINKSANDVWEVMGNQFGHAHVWSSNFITSKPGGEAKFDGLDYSLRDTTTERGNTIQELTAFDPASHSLAYEITAGAPEIAKRAASKWYIVEEGGQSVVHMDSIMEAKMPLPEEMQAKLQMGLTASFQQLADELKYYVENGTPHPSKLESISQ